ncbi:MAG: 4Fe-4S binding protein [Acidilobaceae archaeon]
MGFAYKPVNPDREGFEDLKAFAEKLLAKPSPGSAGRTGVWRLYRPVVHEGKCVKCGICWLYCPENTIIWSFRGIPSVDYEYCKGCGVCSEVCPAKAIDMILEGE